LLFAVAPQFVAFGACLHAGVRRLLACKSERSGHVSHHDRTDADGLAFRPPTLQPNLTLPVKQRGRWRTAAVSPSRCDQDGLDLDALLPACAPGKRSTKVLLASRRIDGGRFCCNDHLGVVGREKPVGVTNLWLCSAVLRSDAAAREGTSQPLIYS
jgi:hypothetical protein